MKTICHLSTAIAILCLAMSVAIAQKPKHYDGIDISHHQGKINWAQVSKDEKIQFVYIKATEGRDFKDPRYKTNIQEARKQKMKVGSYHFFHMSSTAQQQFNNFKSMADKEEQDLIPMIDVEYKWHKKRGCHIDKYYYRNPKQRQAIINRLQKLADLIENHYGCRPMIYCSVDTYRDLLKGTFDDYPLYIGNYRDSQIDIPSCYIWQYSEGGRVKGISSEGGKPKACDLAAFHNDCQLADITIATAKTPKERPTAKTTKKKSQTTAKPQTTKKNKNGSKAKAKHKKAKKTKKK